MAELGAVDSSALVYEDGYEIEQGGVKIGTILKRLGGGAYGTVYLFSLTKGGECAAKAVSEVYTKADERRDLDKKLAVECAIAFAMGRSPFTASVRRMIVPGLPGVETTARGMLLLCDLVDRGDLEEAMGKDYRGELYSEEGAKTWPLPSVTLQILLGFRHMHARGILHQVCAEVSLFLLVVYTCHRAGF